MISWHWALGALFLGIVMGFLAMALLAVGASKYSWRCGYNDGQEVGFQAGLNEKGK